MSFIAELKRRNVFRVGAAYAVLAWLFIQIIETVLPVFGAPGWVLQTLIFIVLLGFPVAIILAWAFELTPEGLKTQHAADDTGAHSAGIKLNTIIILGLALAVVFLLLEDNLTGDGAGTPAEPPSVAEDGSPILQDEITATATLEKTLAVLPFADISPDRDQEYFSDGLSEELLNKLAQVDDLQVTARTSSFYYKGRNDDMRTIGEQLGVNYILEGSVRKAGNNLRITAQLIQANNGFHLWSDIYDRALEDIFVLQDEIAEAVTTALSITLGTSEFNRPGMTRNVEAYQEYLQAFRGPGMTQQGARAAMDHIERAVSLDPEFYVAWGFMNSIYGIGSIAVFPADQVADIVSRRDYAKQLLLEQAPDLPETRAFVIGDLIAERNFVEAERQLLALIADTGGTNSSYNTDYAFLLHLVGRSREAIPYFQVARRLDPLDRGIPIFMYRTLLALDRVGEARLEIERGLGLPQLPDAVVAAFHRGRMYAALQEGDRARAVEALRDASSFGAQPDGIADYWARGDNAAGLEAIRASLANENLSGLIQSAWGQFSILLGDPQLALDIRRRIGDPTTIWMDYASEMRKLPDFKLFMEESGFLDYWRTTGNWADKCRPVNDTFECE